MHLDWYQQNYPLLTGCGIWLRGGEINTVGADRFEPAQLRCLFARLSTWYDVMDSITHPLLYEIAHEVDGVFADCAYLPPSHDLTIFDRDRIPYLLGTQTKRGAEDFDLVGISNSIVQELVNLPTVLARSGIALAKKERLNDPTMPLVILGGANAINTSVLWGEDSPIDGVFVGEDPFAIKQLLAFCRDGKRAGKSKRAILESLELVDGFFITGTGRAVVKSPGSQFEPVVPRHPLVPFHVDSTGSTTLPISEGCQAFCSFCAESWTRKPYRELSLDKAVESALAIKAVTGANRLNLYSFNFNQYGSFYDLVWELSGLVGAIGLKSMRFDTVAQDARLVPLLHALGKSSITCGLEGISGRLRCYLNKKLSLDTLEQSLQRIFTSPVRELKIFLIATGLETEPDFVEFEELVGRVKQLGTATLHHCRLIFSLTPLVRFPWTPQEFETAPLPETLHTIAGKIKHLVCSAGFEFRQAADGPEYWLSQVLVRAAHPEIFPALLTAITQTGFIYYRSVNSAFVNEFRKQLIARGLSEQAVLCAVPDNPPWRQINPRIHESFLKQSHRKISDQLEVDPCAGRETVAAGCAGCGACQNVQKKTEPQNPSSVRRYSADQLKQRMRAYTSDGQPLSFWVTWHESIRQIMPAYRGAILARACMLADSSLVSHYKMFSGSLWQSLNGGEWIHGDDRITLSWSAAGKAMLEKLMTQKTFVAKVNKYLAPWGAVRGISATAEQPVVLHLESPFRFEAQRFCTKAGLKFVQTKTGGVSSYNFGKESLKKQIILSLQSEPPAASVTRVTVLPGKKFDLHSFLTQAFVLSDERFWMETKIAGRIT